MNRRDDFQRGFSASEARSLIRECLDGMGMWSERAEMLLMGTCAQESGMGKWRRQLGGGPALGVMQMEPGTFRDIVDNYLRWRPELLERVMEVSGVDRLEAEDLESNDRLAVCMARVHYARVSAPIPGDLPGQARYWKRWYNTPRGKGTVEEYVENFKRYVG